MLAHACSAALQPSALYPSAAQPAASALSQPWPLPTARSLNWPPQCPACMPCRRVKKNFNARHTCDSRRYEYYLPQWAFDPDLFPARPSWRPPACPADAAVFPPGTPVPDGGAHAQPPACGYRCTHMHMCGYRGVRVQRWRGS